MGYPQNRPNCPAPHICSGGFADVYLAENLAVRAPFALKTPKHEFRGRPEYRHRFQEEAHKAAILRHENIARIYDVVVEDADIFAVMDYIDGETLTAYAQIFIWLVE